MNLLCPNCQKMLTVSDEFAGHVTKCPLCDGTFTVPTLPGAASPPLPAAAPEPDIYPLRPEPPSPPPLVHLPPPAATAAVSPPPQAPADYQHTLVVSLNPKVLPWIAPACFLLIFFLQFFSWVGLYPGGVPSVTQNAWQAALGLYTEDGNLPSPAVEDEKYKPGVSLLTLFYLLLFLPALVLTIASVVIDRLHFVPLPPAVVDLLPWRWGIAAAASLVPFFFLAMQMLLGFSLDTRYAAWVEAQVKTESKGPKSTPQQLAEDSARGKLLQDNYHTPWLYLVVLLHLTAIVSSTLMFWLDRRGPHRPLPRVELKW
jgi:hypothetical protein